MKSKMTVENRDIFSRIITVRGQRVILDADLARMYGVETKVLNKAIKRHEVRFPNDFCFQMTQEEFVDLRFQIGTSNSRRGGRRYRPYAFTEHGAIMAATILNSPIAVQMSVFVVRAFVKMRSILAAKKDFTEKLASLEKSLTERLDLHERVISDIIKQIMSLLNPPPEPEPPRKQIGFHVRERLVPYKCVRKKAKQ